MSPDLQKIIDEEIARYRERIAAGYTVDKWVLPPASCALLARIGLMLGSQATAFEFGSGCSTLTLRESFGGVTSLEDSAHWMDHTETLPGMPPKRPQDKTRAVALTRCHLGMIPYHSFDLDRRIELLQRLESADFILVDSPPNPATREHVLHLTLQHAKPGALVLLDDTEIRATHRFARRLACDNPTLFSFAEIPMDHGMALYQKIAMGHVACRPNLREIVGAWLRR